MKAIVINRFGPPDVFQISNVPEPSLKDDEILIEVSAGSVNPIDFKQRKGNHKFILGSNFPIVLGYDVAGTVRKTGKDVNHFKPGDCVCGVLNNKYGGGLSEYTKGSEKCFAKIPSDFDPHNFAALPLAGLTSLQALRDKGRLKKNEKILILGAAGGVGHYATQIASILEADITATASEIHKSFLNQLAKINFIDYTKTNILEVSQTFHVIFDIVGKYNFIKMKHMLVPGGIYINILPRPKILIHKLISLFTRKKKVKTLLMKHNSEDLQLLINWINQGKLKICIDKTFSIADIGEAHKYMEQGHTEGKILIKYLWPEEEKE